MVGHRAPRSDLSDVMFRVGGAAFATWIYLRTLFVVPAGTDATAWHIFAWTGWPLLIVIWIGAAISFRDWWRWIP